MMNGSTTYNHINLPTTSWTPRPDVEATLIMYILIGATATSIFVHLIKSQNLECTRRYLDAFVSTPAKLITFLLLGRALLRHFGYLNNLPLSNVIGVGGFGGLGLSMIYLFQRHLFTTSSCAFIVGEEYEPRRKEVVLDWALQEEMALKLVCEMYHAVAGVVMGFLAMRLLTLCALDYKHLDLLMTAGLLGPVISFVLVILLAVIGFGAIWCLYRCNRWLHNRKMLKDISFLAWSYCKWYN